MNQRDHCELMKHNFKFSLTRYIYHINNIYLKATANRPVEEGGCMNILINWRLEVKESI